MVWPIPILVHPRSASTPISERGASIASPSPFTIEEQTADSAGLYSRSEPPIQHNRSGDFSPEKDAGIHSASQPPRIRNETQRSYDLLTPSQSDVHSVPSIDTMMPTGGHLTPSNKRKIGDTVDIISPIEEGTGGESVSHSQTRRNVVASSLSSQPSSTPTRKRYLGESDYLASPAPARTAGRSSDSPQARRNALVHSMVSQTDDIPSPAYRGVGNSCESSDTPQARREALVRKMIYQPGSTQTSASRQKTRAFNDPPDPNRPKPSPANKLALERALENLAKGERSKKGFPHGFTIQNSHKSNDRSNDEDLFVDQKRSYSPLSEAGNSDNDPVQQGSRILNTPFTQDSDKEGNDTPIKEAKSLPAGPTEQDVAATASSLNAPQPRSVLSDYMIANIFLAYKSAIGSKRKSFNFCNTVLKFFAQARAAKTLQQIKEDDILVASIPGHEDRYIPRGDVEAFDELLEEIAGLGIWSTGGAAVEVSVELAQ